MFIGKYNKTVIITYIGVAFAILGMFLALDGYYSWTFICFISSCICDMFDGSFARMFERTQEEKEFGIQLDSLADMVSFIALPVVISYALGLTRWFYTVICVFYTVCGIIRLAYFNCNGLDNGNYSGLPVTCSILILLPAYCLSKFLPSNAFTIVYACAMALTGLLFILNFKIKKPSKKWYPLFTGVGILCIVVLIIGMK